MHFSATTDGSGSKLTKIAVVAALHVAVAGVVINSMNSKVFTMPQVIEDITIFTPEAPKPPPPPPEPPQPKQKPTTQPKIVAPKVEVEVQQPPPVEAQVQTTTEADPAPADPGPVVEAPPAPPSTNTGEMFSAALANAGDCEKPDYPAKAARNGETGTVSLALLIGPDGRVSDSKIQKSSGSRELDRAAQNALSLCTFKPAMANGAPTSGWGRMAYVWTLD